MTDSPAGYDPPPVGDLIDPAIRDETHHKGAQLVREALAENGITKTGKTWKRQIPTEGDPR